MNTCELVVIIPVYNESACIAQVLENWQEVLAKVVDGKFEILVYDDGSTDHSFEEISKISHRYSHILALQHPNMGHGPSILRGYRAGIEKATWMLQIDSDDEINPQDFPLFWEAREQHDFIIGKRIRTSPPVREFISRISRAVTRSLFGPAVYDVNCPFRLLRSTAFRDIIPAIPQDTFAPNLLISGAASLQNLRIKEIYIQHTFRATGHVSIRNLKLFKVAWKSFVQTCRFYLRYKKR